MTLYEHYNVNDNAKAEIHENFWDAQTFTVGSVGNNEDHKITSVKIKVRKSEEPGIANVLIRELNGAGKPTGENKSVGSFDANSITAISPGEWKEVSMSAFKLSADGKYALILNAPEAVWPNMVFWRYESPGGYAGGGNTWSEDSGVTWMEIGGVDFMFEIWGELPAVVKPARSHVGFKPIVGDERLRGIRRNAIY